MKKLYVLFYALVMCMSFLQAQIALPYFENFGTIVAANGFPTVAGGAWTRSTTTTLQPTYITNQSNNRSGNGDTKYITYRYNCGTAYYFVGPFTLNAGTSYTTSILYKSDGATGFGPLELNYGTTAAAGTQTNLIASVPANITNLNFAPISGAFTPAVTGSYYISVKCVSTSFTPYYVTLDDFTVSITPTCFTPTALNSSNITSTTANINWTASVSNPSSGYDYYYSNSSTPPTALTTPSGSTTIGVTTANLTSLTANTTYYFWVRSNCGSGDLSSWAGSAQFFTGYCTPAPTSVDGQGITNVSFSTVNNTTVAESGNYGNYSAQVGDIVQGISTDVNITFKTGFDYDTKVWIDWNDDLDFVDAGEEVYSGTSLSANPTTLVATFTVPVAAPLGQHRMRIGGVDVGPPTPCYTGTYGTYEDYTVNVVAPSTDAMDYANLQFPATANIIAGGSATIYTQGFEPGVTPGAGAGPGITVWIGVNATNTDPATWAGGAWTAATFNTQVGNNDEFQANIGSSLPTGTYYYASRWQLNSGPLVYGGYNVGGGGFWNGTSNVSGVLTVNPPSNDDAAGAISLTVNSDFNCGVTTAGTTFGATQSPDAAPTCTGINDDVWYTFIATGSNHRISFSGTTNSMVAAVYSGTPGSLVFITGACATTTLNVTGLSGGTTYYVRAYTSSGTIGTISAFNICVGTPPPPPINDICSGAIIVPSSGPFPYLTGVSDNTTATNTNDPTNTCQANSNAGVWYSFTPNVTGSYIISSCQSDAPLSAISDNVLSVFASNTGCTGPFAQVACDDDGCTTLSLQGYLTTSLTAGTQYYILIYGYNTNRGNIQLSVAQANPPPANDECASAVNLTPSPGIFTNPGTQTSTGATQSAQVITCEVLDVLSTDVWYKFTTDSDGTPNEKIKITVTPLNFQDFDMQLSTGSCAALTEVVCAITVSTGPEVLMFNEVGFNGGEIEVRDNTTYYLRVIDYDGIGGNFTISATGSTALPVNILSFDAKALKNKTVQLTWNVASEVDVREYIVERSNDNRNWSAIGSVKASQKSTYGFNDNSPVSGVNYYRLAVKDVNASAAYSDIRTVNFSGKGNMALYPNPANNTLYVSGTDDKNVVVSIYNEVGQIVNTLSSNGETIRTGGIDVSQLLPGAYSIQVKGESGLTTMRFVKQ